MNDNSDSKSYVLASVDNGSDRHWRVAICAGTLIAAAFMLFWNLGHYSLWVDEAVTALSGKSVLATGDTSAWVDDKNLSAYGSGLELRGMHARMTPPLTAYLTAASFAVFGVTTWAARFPFALAGLFSVALMLWWARRTSLQYLMVLAIAILGNASLFLYMRGCRYYATATFFSIVIAYVYWNWRGGKSKLLVMALASSALFASHYIMFFAVYTGIVVDYFVWHRKEAKLSSTDWMVLLLPQAVISGVIGWIWNPLRTSIGGSVFVNSFLDRLELSFWNLREANMLEYLVLPLILTALIVGWHTKTNIARPFRVFLAILLACLVTGFLTKQVRAGDSLADARYLVYLIPPGIALGAWAVCTIMPTRKGWAVLLACAVFFSNFFNGGMYFNWCGVRSTSFCYVRELLHPTNTDPFKETARWMRENIAPGKTVLVEWMINDLYPLMFLAPHVVYAWQFDDRSNPQFASLPAIHFKGEEMPDYLIGFGPQVERLKNDLKKYGKFGVSYQVEAKIDTFWKDLYRPELNWRTFKPVENYNKDRDVVYVFRRADATLLK